MGYWASGSGTITLCKDFDKDVVNKAIDKASDEFESFDCWMPDNQVSFSITDYHWHDEDMDDFLNLLIDYTVDGCVEMEGEEGEHWKLQWNDEEERWETFYGNVIFEDDLTQFSDDVLIAELRSRGYEVVIMEEV